MGHETKAADEGRRTARNLWGAVVLNIVEEIALG